MSIKEDFKLYADKNYYWSLLIMLHMHVQLIVDIYNWVYVSHISDQLDFIPTNQPEQ